MLIFIRERQTQTPWCHGFEWRLGQKKWMESGISDGCEKENSPFPIWDESEELKFVLQPLACTSACCLTLWKWLNINKDAQSSALLPQTHPSHHPFVRFPSDLCSTCLIPAFPLCTAPPSSMCRPLSPPRPTTATPCGSVWTCVTVPYWSDPHSDWPLGSVALEAFLIQPPAQA